MHHREDSSPVGESQSKKIRADLENTKSRRMKRPVGLSALANVNKDEHGSSEDSFDADSQLLGNAVLNQQGKVKKQL